MKGTSEKEKKEMALGNANLWISLPWFFLQKCQIWFFEFVFFFKFPLEFVRIHNFLMHSSPNIFHCCFLNVHTRFCDIIQIGICAVRLRNMYYCTNFHEHTPTHTTIYIFKLHCRIWRTLYGVLFYVLFWKWEIRSIHTQIKIKYLSPHPIV